MIADRSLRFWLHYLESEGALHQEREDAFDLLLPAELGRRLKLPEAVSVTGDPEVADEEGALLVIPGASVLDAAAEEVLRRGDCASAYVPWPANAHMSPSEVIDDARRRLDVDHGRVDASGKASPVYYPLLLLCALVTYTAEERFVEREEAWVDGRSALPLRGEIARVLSGSPRLAMRDASHPVLQPRIEPAASVGHAALLEQARRRAVALARSASAMLRDELDRTRSYYDNVLASIDARRAVQAERRALFDAQERATQSERDRRLGEIAAKFTPAIEINPYRIHVIFVPAFAIEACVRRGERRYEITFHRFLGSAGYAQLRCPSCNAPAPLVAGRRHLGCRSCAGSHPEPVTLSVSG